MPLKNTAGGPRNNNAGKQAGRTKFVQIPLNPTYNSELKREKIQMNSIHFLPADGANGTESWVSQNQLNPTYNLCSVQAGRTKFVPLKNTAGRQVTTQPSNENHIGFRNDRGF